jgi:hypothetical protein
MAKRVGSAVPNQVDPHLEFRTLSMLFNAVTTINRKQPSELPQAYDPKYYTRTERTSRHDLALHAFATILIRDPREVVAVVAHVPSRHEPLHVYAMQEEKRVYAVEGDSTVQSLMSKISALANPDKRRKGSKGPIPIYKEAPLGTSNYPRISGSHWDCLNIR